jgi:hypothetical protein
MRLSSDVLLLLCHSIPEARSHVWSNALLSGVTADLTIVYDALVGPAAAAAVASSSDHSSSGVQVSTITMASQLRQST